MAEPQPVGAPLVLTLALEPAAQAAFEQLRRQYFPARLNRIPAHITLFHALPGEEAAAIRATLANAVVDLPRFELDVSDVKKLGRGVAYALISPVLERLHADLRREWLPWLSRQDQQPYRPHIVVQNKVDPQQALQTYDALARTFRPYKVQADSLLLWRYLGGPWELDSAYDIGGA